MDLKNSYKKIDWSDTPVYEDKLNTNNNKLDISLEEAEKTAIDFLEHNNYNWISGTQKVRW